MQASNTSSDVDIEKSPMPFEYGTFAFHDESKNINRTQRGSDEQGATSNIFRALLLSLTVVGSIAMFACLMVLLWALRYVHWGAMKVNFLGMSLDSWELVLGTIGAQILAFFRANAYLPLDLNLCLIRVHEMRLSSRRSELLCKSEQCWRLCGTGLRSKF